MPFFGDHSFGAFCIGKDTNRPGELLYCFDKIPRPSSSFPSRYLPSLDNPLGSGVDSSRICSRKR